MRTTLRRKEQREKRYDPLGTRDIRIDATAQSDREGNRKLRAANFKRLTVATMLLSLVALHALSALPTDDIYIPDHPVTTHFRAIIVFVLRVRK